MECFAIALLNVYPAPVGFSPRTGFDALAVPSRLGLRGPKKRAELRGWMPLSLRAVQTPSGPARPIRAAGQCREKVPGWFRLGFLHTVTAFCSNLRMECSPRLSLVRLAVTEPAFGGNSS